MPVYDIVVVANIKEVHTDQGRVVILLTFVAQITSVMLSLFTPTLAYSKSLGHDFKSINLAALCSSSTCVYKGLVEVGLCT